MESEEREREREKGLKRKEDGETKRRVTGKGK